jgi:hypothetical protein
MLLVLAAVPCSLREIKIGQNKSRLDVSRSAFEAPR